MTTSRMEAFSDGVIAIIITIMVLELRPPHDTSLKSLAPLLPILLSYVMSFIYVGIYWNNHHHLLHAAEHVNGRVLWSNLLLLFSLSLIPFTTAWMGENHFAKWPVILYGFLLLCSGLSYTVLVRALLKLHGPKSLLANALGTEFKEYISLVIYLIAIGLAFIHPLIACAGYVLVAIIWLIPDRRIERRVAP